MGRGTTLLEAGFLGRKPLGCDLNPLGQYLLQARLNPPSENEVARRINSINFDSSKDDLPEELLTFYHPETLSELCALRHYLQERKLTGCNDRLDDWIRLVATSRLTGHSSGFFSVYTLPPNQAVSVSEQTRINERRQQRPPRRLVKDLILKKTHSLLSRIDQHELEALRNSASEARILTGPCHDTPEIRRDSVSLIVTSPPFLDVVDYQKDNWLRSWFNHIDDSQLPSWQLRKEEDWIAAMIPVFRELERVLTPGGLLAFEVGEIRAGTILMESLVVPAAQRVGLRAKLVMVNEQSFTKTSHCWGVTNDRKGTNTNRIVLLQKET